MSQILLDTLKDGLDSEYQVLLQNNPQFLKQAEQYLSELLINDDLLSTEAFMASSELQQTSNTTMTQSESTATTKRTLIEEIAELDMNQRAVNLKLSSLTDSNRDLIIDISNDLQLVHSKLNQEYQSQIDSLMKLIDNEKNSSFHSHHHHNDNYKYLVNLNNSILDKIDSVLDILELPTLCRLCILQGNYQESLEISMLIQALIIRFPKLSIFIKIHEKIEYELKLMVNGLVKLLNTNLKQNNILKIFQILNKLDLSGGSLLFNNSHNGKDTKYQKDKFLKLIYLNSRYKFIINEIESLKPLIKFNKLSYLKRFIETYREFIFNSLSIFNIIFKPTTATSEDDNENSLLINQFIRSLAGLLCRELSAYLPDIKLQNTNTDDLEAEIDLSSQIDGLILQIIYLCKSLSNFQVDFEPIILNELCYTTPTPLISESDWLRNSQKVKRHRH